MRTSEVLDRYLRLIAEIYTGYLREIPSDKAQAFAGSLLELRRGTRWYQISTPQQIDEIWSTIRTADKDAVLLDYIVMGTAELSLRARDHDAEWTNVIGQIIQSLVWVHSDSYVDEAIRDRAPDGQWLKETFGKCPWLVFLFLHQFVPQA